MRYFTVVASQNRRRKINRILNDIDVLNGSVNGFVIGLVIGSFDLTYVRHS